LGTDVGVSTSAGAVGGKLLPMERLATIITISFVFAFGASIGSFLNVVVHRLPIGLSLLKPPSRCPHCFHKLGKQENIPIVGWLRLGGRCRWCKAPISARYPFVEAVTGLLFTLIFWQFGFTVATVGYWFFISWLLALSLIDIDTMTLPNTLTQSGLMLGLGFQALEGWQTSQTLGLSHYLFVGIGSAVLGIWIFDLIGLVGAIALGQTAMGGGDPKLAAMIGAWLGWQSLLVAGFLACAIGAVAGGSAIALGWLSRRQPMPFGPFLALGAFLAVFWGQVIVSAYIKLFFPLS
jgi:leader peptidase (prepilin peptidase)/N-methyltransferase